MKRHFKLLVIVVLSITGIPFLTTGVKAQYYFYDENYYDNPILFEVGGSIGAMNCLTDLGGKPGLGKQFVKDLTLGTTNVSFGGFISATYQNKIGLRFEGTVGSLEANDASLKGVTDIALGRYWRNLSFQTSIREFSLMAEIHPLFILRDYEALDKEAPRFSPYLLGGIGLFNFNPRAKNDAGVLVDLHPLRLEGQGFPEYPDVKPYKLSQTNVPLGLGVKFELSPLINLRAELVHRMLFTDYLDDVSGSYIDPVAFYNNLDPSDWENALTMYDRQLADNKYWGVGGKRGNPDQNDSYFTFNLKVSMLFRRAIND
jgi:hypothetical protein